MIIIEISIGTELKDGKGVILQTNCDFTDKTVDCFWRNINSKIKLSPFSPRVLLTLVRERENDLANSLLSFLLAFQKYPCLSRLISPFGKNV